MYSFDPSCAGSHIAVFGSYVMDLYTGSSDLDLSLNVGYSQMERSRADKIAILRKLTRALYSLHNGVYILFELPFILEVFFWPSTNFTKDCVACSVGVCSF